jgi:hypothetical protein
MLSGDLGGVVSMAAESNGVLNGNSQSHCRNYWDLYL